MVENVHIYYTVRTFLLEIYVTCKNMYKLLEKVLLSEISVNSFFL